MLACCGTGLRRVVSEGAQTQAPRIPSGPDPAGLRPSWRAHLPGRARRLGQGAAPGPRPARDPRAHRRSVRGATTCDPRRGLMEEATACAVALGTVELSLQCSSSHCVTLCPRGAPFPQPRQSAGCTDTHPPPDRSQFVMKKGKKEVLKDPAVAVSTLGQRLLHEMKPGGVLGRAPGAPPRCDSTLGPPRPFLSSGLRSARRASLCLQVPTRLRRCRCRLLLLLRTADLPRTHAEPPASQDAQASKLSLFLSGWLTPGRVPKGVTLHRLL